MDQELLELLARLQDEANPLTDAELTQLADAIIAVAADVDPGDVSDEDIAVLTEARDHLSTVRAVQTERSEAAAVRSAAAAELLGEITPPAVEVVETVPPIDDLDDAAPTVEEVEAAEVVAEAAEVVEAAPVPVAAAAEPVAPTRLPTISHLAHRRPPSRKPIVAATESANRPRTTLVASADIPGVAAGAEIEPRDWATGVMRKWESIRRAAPTQGAEKVYLGSIKYSFPEERSLDRDNEWDNEEKINSLVASGGICGPVAVDYNLSTIAQASRPVRDGLAQFGATRGGVRFVLPHTLQAVTTDGPAALWTSANDISLNSPATKPNATYLCQGVQEVLVDAVTSIVKMGNMQAMYFPEQVTQYMETAAAVHARLGEATLLASMTTGSTSVNAGNYAVGAAREILAIIDRAAAAMRYRHRMAPESALHVIYPEWLEDMIREDLAKNLPGDSGGHSERLAVADAEIDTFFRVRNINVTNAQDSPTGAAVLQGWTAQAAGDLQPWPTKTVIWLYPEGSWMFLDGGQLDLGLVRDSTLNKTNDLTFFSESFEKAAFRGHESLAITCTIAPTGSTIGTEAPTVVAPTLGS